MAYDYLARIQILGQYGVGKAAICERFVYDTFKVSSNYGAYQWYKIVNIYGKIVKLDIRSRCVYRSGIQEGYFAPCALINDAYMIVFDITNSETFSHAKSLVEEVVQNCSDPMMILVGNKWDLEKEQAVPVAEIKKYADEYQMEYMETSAKLNYNIDEVFEFIIKSLLKEKHNITVEVHIKEKEKMLLFKAKKTRERKENEKALRKSLKRAKKEHGTIPVRFLKLFFTGSGAAGKTSFINLLLKKEFNRFHRSTNVVHTSHAVSIKKADLHRSDFEVTWTEFDSDYKINLLCSILLPKPSVPLETGPSTNSELSTEEVATQSKPVAVINQNKSPRPQPTLKQYFTGLFESSGKDLNLSTFDSIIDAKESDPIAYHPGKVLNIITLLDTGGHPDYIHLLPTINIYPTVSFVIHDLSKRLSDQVRMLVEFSQHGKHMFIPYHLSYSNLDLIKLLVSAANALERPITNFPLVSTPGTTNKSYICLVGTHKDTVQVRVKEEVGRQLVTLVNELNCETAVWQNDEGGVLFSVDNTTTGSKRHCEDPVANVIRKKIEMLADQKDIYEPPITWMLLELEIRHACSERQQAYISFQECVTTARKTGLMSTVEEIKSVLLYHHLLGALIYFDKIPGLRDYVIIDHQWWYDKLSSIISITFQKASHDTHAIQKLKYQGLLTKEVLQSTRWKDDIKEEFFLSLLVHIRIVAPIRAEKKLEYFIPFILPACNLKQNSELLEQYGHLQGVSLLVKFQLGLLPIGMFCSLIVELLQHSPRSWHPQFLHEGVHHTFSNLITFQIHNGYFFSLLNKVSYLEVQIRHPEEDFSIPVHNGVYNYLVYALTEVCIHLNFDFEKLQFGFLCQCGKGIDNHIAVVPDITSSMLHAECSLDSLHLVKLDSSHLVWFTLAKASSMNNDHCKPSSSSGVQETVDLLIDDNPNQPALKRPAMRLLHEVVIPRIAADWSIVADYLEYEIEDKQVIKEKCQNDPKKCCVELMENWLSSNRGVSPKSWSRLIEALRGIRSLTATTEKIVQDLTNAGVVVTM